MCATSICNHYTFKCFNYPSDFSVTRRLFKPKAAISMRMLTLTFWEILKQIKGLNGNKSISCLMYYTNTILSRYLSQLTIYKVYLPISLLLGRIHQPIFLCTEPLAEDQLVPVKHKHWYHRWLRFCLFAHKTATYNSES